MKLALGIGGGILGYNNQQKAASDTAAAEAEYKAAAQNAASQYQTLAQPYLTAGGSQLSMALQGSLAPAQMQQFQAAQAQLAQGAERTGGVGAIQSTAALQNIYQQALQNQQNMAIQLLGPGNRWLQTLLPLNCRVLRVVSSSALIWLLKLTKPQ